MAPVFVRIKPLGQGKTGTSEIPGSLRYCDKNFQIAGKQFTFPDAVIPPEASQDMAYAKGDVDSYLNDFLDGIDVNVLAYGQTGSGKTHTVYGPPGLMERAGRGEFGTDIIPEYGLFPRALFAILDKLPQLRDAGRKLSLTASAVELADGFNKADMLAGKSPTFCNLKVRPAKLFGQRELVLNTREDALPLFAALATRNSRATLLNDSSSRSHCFVVLTLLEAQGASGAELVSESRFQFVDMAGSERLKDAHGNVVGYSSPGTMEGLMINYSLIMLSQCIRDVAKSKNPSDISFRKYMVDLVHLLQASLLGDARTILYVCLHQSQECEGQSYNACDFGLHFSTIRIRPARSQPRKAREMARQAALELVDSERALAGTIRNPDIRTLREATVRNCKQSIEILNGLVGRVIDIGTGAEESSQSSLPVRPRGHGLARGSSQRSVGSRK